jgi:hypothetical protein
MRVLFFAAALVLTSCAIEQAPNPPPTGSFYFPEGVAHLQAPSSAEGVLFVASTNFDRRFDFGTLSAVDLSAVPGLPALGAPATGNPLELVELNIPAEAIAAISSFAGQFALVQNSPTTARLFIPSQSEGYFLDVIDATAEAGQPVRLDRKTEFSLVGVADKESGLPRAPQPIVAAASRDADPQVYVTHVQPADTPPNTGRDFRNYVVRVSAANPELSSASYIQVGGGSNEFTTGGTHGVAVGTNYTFVTGTLIDPIGNMVRIIHRATETVFNPQLELEFRARFFRGIALSTDETRLYIASRDPDMLLVVDVQTPPSPNALPVVPPTLRVVRAVPLPDDPNDVEVISRPEGDLVVVTCTAAGSVALYDAAAGEVVSQLTNIGIQPFGVAIDRRGNAARLYVSIFGDGRVAVIDIPDLSTPRTASVVAHLGGKQNCILLGARDPACATLETP